MRTYSVSALVGLLSVSAIVSCKPRKEALSSGVKDDSAHATILDGYVENALALVPRTTSTKDYEAIIRDSQLAYAIGQLNGRWAGASIAQAEIKVGQWRKVKGESLYVAVPYSAHFRVAWAKDDANRPSRYQLVLPLKVNDTALAGTFFARAFGESCSEEDHESSSFDHFYYYRPEKETCPLKDLVKVDSDEPETTEIQKLDILRVPMFLRERVQPAEGKAPEYSRLWDDDGKLVVTLVMAKDQEGSSSETDEGTVFFNNTVAQVRDMLTKRLGKPLNATEVEAIGNAPGPKRWDVAMRFAGPTEGTEVDVRALLIDNPYENKLIALGKGFVQRFDEFKKIYAERSGQSDLIFYGGHSRLGKAVRDIGRLSTVAKGKYRLVMIDSCASYAYLDNAIGKRIEEANPGQKASKYMDAIVNAMPSPFDADPNTMVTVLEAMLDRKDSFREILGRFDSRQIAIVTGEEDNGEAFP